MRLVLHGLSALPVLLSSYAIDHQRGDHKVLHDCFPDPAALAYLSHTLPQVKPPYWFLAPSWRAPREDYRVVSTAYAYPAGSFYKVASGLYAAAPELCFVQLGKRVSRIELILYGSALCGTFVIDPAAHGGLGKRRPLTTSRRIAKFIAQNSHLTGIANARSALPYLVDNAASPPEIFLHMALSLPHFMGGFELPDCKTNHRIALNPRAHAIARRRTLVPDCCWPEKWLAVEYDSNAEHLTGPQVTQDATKRLALEAEGFRVMTVTTRQLVDRARMGSIAQEIARHLGIRLRIRSAKFPHRQVELFRRGWSLDRLFDPGWLYATQEPHETAGC